MGNPLDNRQLKLLSGEAALRTHLPEDAAVSAGLHYSHYDNEWLVVVKIHTDARSIEVGREPLDEFPSELMIAQAMLVT